jgi:K+-sensing histidine kinase KdpD
MPLNKKEGNIKSIIENILPSFNDIKEKKNLQIKIQEKKSKFNFDPVIIQKVLQKLLHNAFKFAEDQSTIEIVLDSNITVTNQGPTLTESQIQHILKPFQLDENIMHHSQGMGLGLSLCQALLERHDSKLQIISKNQKTSVSFTL